MERPYSPETLADRWGCSAEGRRMIAALQSRLSTLPRPIRWLLIAFAVLFVFGPITSAVCWLASKFVSQRGEVKWEL